jgi:hypothetical protein
MDEATYPFGRPSTSRPPRKPQGRAGVFVVGAYPSALHVRWTPPAWARSELGVSTVGALAVDDEPIVFWDGADAEERVAQWRRDVQFRTGDERDTWGWVHAASNGTSGQRVVDQVLVPLGVSADETWFSDVVDRFFIKFGHGKRGQADAIAAGYAPFAAAAGLPKAKLPTRPKPAALVELAVRDHAQRLVAELAEAASSVVVTLGEEARQVLLALADAAEGPPTQPLEGRLFQGDAQVAYGEAGEARVGNLTFRWHALKHPGQRTEPWPTLHEAWVARRGDGAPDGGTSPRG